MANTRIRTFFQNANSWPMKDSADSMDGWNSAEVSKWLLKQLAMIFTANSFTTSEVVFISFHRRLSSLNDSFKFFNFDVRTLCHYLEGETFARIEV